MKDNVYTYLHFLLLAFFFISCQKENTNADLKQKVLEYMKAKKNSDFKGVSQLLYPPFVQAAGGEKILVKHLNQNLNNSNFSIKIEDNTNSIVLKETNSFKSEANKGFFCVGTYETKQVFHMEDSTGKTFSEIHRRIGLNKTKNTKINLDSLSNKIIVSELVYFVGIKDEQTNKKWKLLNYAPVPMVEQLIPTDALQEIKKLHKENN